MLNQLAQTYNKAQQCRIIAQTWYTLLCADIENGVIELGRPYNGYIVSTIWDSRPIAWRPRPCYRYIFDFPELPLDHHPRVAGDPIAGYITASKAEKDAWAEYDALYQQVVTAYVRGELSVAPNLSTGEVPATTLRIYEVKPVK